MEWKWSVFCFCLDCRSVLHLSPEAPLTPRPATAPDAPCRCPYAPPRPAPPPLTRPRTAWRGWAETCWRPSLRVRIRSRTVPKKKRSITPPCIYLLRGVTASVSPAARCTEESSERSARCCWLDHKHDVVAGEGAALRSVACSRSGCQRQQCSICPASWLHACFSVTVRMYLPVTCHVVIV